MTAPNYRASILPGQRVRAVLVWIVGATTLCRVVDPIVADYQHEVGQHTRRGSRLKRMMLSARWGWALVAALLLDALTRPYSAGERRALAHVWKHAAVGCGLMMVFVMSFTGVPLTTATRAIEFFVLLTPSQLAVAIPFGVLLGALAAQRSFLPSRRPVVAMSLASAVVVCCLVTVVYPRANQAWRVLLYESLAGSKGPSPTMGPSEMSFSELRQAEAATAATGVDARMQSRYRVERQRRLALTATCVVFGCVGMAFAGTWMARTFTRRLMLGAGAATAYYALSILGSRVATYPQTGWVAAVWLPPMAFSMLAMAAELLRRRAELRACVKDG